ncbi:MAG: hypothetical protein ABI438_06765 [Dermatophilaceae bacterium]
MTMTAPSTGTSAGASHSRPGLTGKIAAVLVMLVGAGLVATTLVTNLFAVGPAFENLITDFRPALTQSSIDTAHKDIAGLSAVQEEFSTKLAPALSQQLKMTPDQFNGFVAKSFPAVAAGMGALPTAVPTFDGLINTLDKQRPLFASADAIPTTGLPATTVPWGLLGAGILIFLIGLAMLRSPKVGGAVAVVVGLAVLVLPLVLSLPAKAADADQLNANLKPIYNKTLVDNATGALGTIGAMGNEMGSTMLPALATQLKMSPEQLQGFLGTNFPATAQALQTMPASMERFNGLVKVFDNNLANYETIKPVGMQSLIVLMMGAGGLVAVLGGVSVATSRKK